MTGTLVPIIVTEDWSGPDNTSPTGIVDFDLSAAITAPGYVSPNTVQSNLVNGAVAQELVANDFDSGGGVVTPMTQYRVTEGILGAPEQEYYIIVPAAPPGSRSVDDGVIAVGSQILFSETADFTDDDERAYVLLEGFPPGTQIESVTDSTHAVLTTGSTMVATGVGVLIRASVTLQSLRPT